MQPKTRAALLAAEEFIVNGVAFGYITMPDADMPDSAHKTLPLIRAALAQDAAPELGWWCPVCKRYCEPREVTYQERHETCGTSVTAAVPPPPVSSETAEPPARQWSEHAGSYVDLPPDPPAEDGGEPTTHWRCKADGVRAVRCRPSAPALTVAGSC